MPLVPYNYDRCRAGLDTNLSRTVYQYIQDNVMLVHYKYVKWRQDLGTDFCESIINYGNLHKEVYKVTNVPKLRSFQYRLLQRALVTNIHLYKWKMREDDLCSFCKLEAETIQHLFVMCPIVNSLWEDVWNLLDNLIRGQVVEKSVSAILLNQVVQPVRSISNFICLITKQYIYRQRCMKKIVVLYRAKEQDI